jgi:hypothetical protein
MDERGRDVLRRLLDRRDPSRELLFEVEMLHAGGVHALCDMLASGTLNERQQLRALQGLSYAAKHSGHLEQLQLLEVALPRVTTPYLALRSRAAHTVVCAIGILKGLRWGNEHPSELAGLRERVAPSLREGLALGFVEPTRRLVEIFLAPTLAD